MAEEMSENPPFDVRKAYDHTVEALATVIEERDRLFDENRLLRSQLDDADEDLCGNRHSVPCRDISCLERKARIAARPIPVGSR